jgi:hypothetical protein
MQFGLGTGKGVPKAKKGTKRKQGGGKGGQIRAPSTKTGEQMRNGEVRGQKARVGEVTLEGRM